MLPRSFRLPARASSDESVLLLYKMPTPDEHGKGGKSAARRSTGESRVTFVPRARARGTAPSGVTSISAISLSQTSTGTFTCSASRSCKRSSVTRLLCLLTAASFRRLLFMIPVMLFSAGCQTLITSV